MNDASDIAGAATVTSSTRDGSALAAETVGQKIGRYRWVICGLLFFATTVNYVDRQVLGILSKDLKAEIGWTEVDYGNIVAAFNAAYAFGLLACGTIDGSNWNPHGLYACDHLVEYRGDGPRTCSYTIRLRSCSRSLGNRGSRKLSRGD